MTRSSKWWVLAAAIVGFGSSFIFSRRLMFEGSSFILLHSLVVVGFVAAHARVAGFNPINQLRRRWLSGVVGGVLVGLGLVQLVAAGSGSTRPHGAAGLTALGGYGVLYGTVDALLLSVVPVIALYGFRSPDELARGGGRLRWAGVALLGSIVITAAHYLGFSDNRGLVQFVAGNAAMTLIYLVTGSPLGPIVSHVLTHVAAVWTAVAATGELPPVY